MSAEGDARPGGGIKVRRLPFEFPDDIPFWFNPANRRASVMVNTLSLHAPAFERYFIRAIRDAMPRISDPATRAEANRFCLQEGQHAKVHTEHLNLLLRKHPQLEVVRDEINASYDHLHRTESNEFALAYATTVELNFKPLARFLIDNRRSFFGGGDPRISAFVLWHFVEEFEHRHAMFDVYQDVVGDYRFRLSTARWARRHVNEMNEKAMRACLACEPPPRTDPSLPRVSRRQRLRLAAGILETLSPLHDPRRGGTPEWITDWFSAEARGADMTAVAL